MQVRIGEEREHSRSQPAALRPDAAPAPLVLQFVEGCFRHSPVALEPTNVPILVERDPENQVFVDSGRLADLGEGMLRCAVLVLR